MVQGDSLSNMLCVKDLQVVIIVVVLVVVVEPMSRIELTT